jgi:hypothetical protein
MVERTNRIVEGQNAAAMSETGDYSDIRDMEGDQEVGETEAGFTLPDDFDSEQDFIRHAVRLYDNDQVRDALNTQAMIDDFQFVAGKQWDKTAESARLANRKPVLTINRLPAYIAQVVGNRLLNQTVIQVLPDRGGTKPIARIRQGLIRQIEKTSKADNAYDTALTNALIGGLGNFGLSADYADYDVFEQDLAVRRLVDPTAVTWDHLSVETTGRDARHVFVEEMMSRSDFDADYPDATPAAFGGETSYINQLTANGWFTNDSVRIVEFWRMRFEERLVILNKFTGEVNDVTGIFDEEEAKEYAAVNPQTGQLMLRIAQRPYAEMYLMTAMNILEGPFRMNCSRVPIFRVPGWEIHIGEDRHRFGMIRFAKDPQRIHNYWRSVIVEKLMQTPRAKWVATKEAVKGFESAWKNSHKTDDMLLLWNGDSGQPPQQVQPAQIEPALIGEANMATQDIRDVLNMHEASMGQQSNEVSGKALDRRQRVSELGTVIYFSHLNDAIEECGRCMNEVMPDYYDTFRQLTIIGEDDKAKVIEVNGDNLPDITMGKYSVTVTTGPSYTTKRIEAVESMMALANAAPQAMAPALDLLVENMDWPGAEAIAKRLRASLPPGVVMADPEDMTPEEQQAAAGAAQKAQQQEAITMKDMELTLAQKELMLQKTLAEIEEIKAKAAANKAKAIRDVAEAKKADSETQAIEINTNLDIASYMDNSINPEEEQTE